MRISVFGAGYVGAVTSACLCKSGHEVIAVDVSQEKVDAINRGTSPIVEEGVDELFAEAVAAGRLSATCDAAEAIATTEMSIVCVGTPSLANGNLNLAYILDVCRSVGPAIAAKASFHSVVFRSTMLPGSMNDVVIPALELASGMQAGKGFGVAIFPEFLRESTAVMDYFFPEVTVMGRRDDLTIERLRSVNCPATRAEYVVDIPTAEMIKYTNNCWHATKIVFANEIGNICKKVGVDGHLVMEVLCADKRLNVSAAYMKPGMAFGGSCLPKDLRALRYRATQLDVATPLLESVSSSNALQIDRAFDSIMVRAKEGRVGLLGLSFKSGTDDLRESPLVEIAERLYGKGIDLRIYDENVRFGALNGSNLSFVNTRLPHLSKLMVDELDEIYDHAEVIVVGNADPRFADVMERRKPAQSIVDLVRITKDGQRSSAAYEGLCW
ncbi:MAG: UDP-glucose/GDP-mannose dehydrogenase family protein [Novosphingobium sp.]